MTMFAILLSAVLGLRVVALVVCSSSARLAAAWFLLRWRWWMSGAIAAGLGAALVADAIGPTWLALAYLMSSGGLSVLALVLHAIEMRRARAYRVEMPVAIIRRLPLRAPTERPTQRPRWWARRMSRTAVR